jgi:type II secretory pathway component PulJ
MRKAFTLMELLVLMAILPLMMVVVSGIFATFIRDTPRETRVVQENATVLDVLANLRRDVDGAVALPQRFDATEAGDQTLLIEQPDAVVCYRLEAGRAVRALLKGRGPADPNEQRVWRMPDAAIAWRPWTRADGAYAVEVHSHVQQQVGPARYNKLVNSYVFFVRGLGKGREVR